MSWITKTPPASEPITLADAKLHLRVDTTADDALITALIQAAREHVENITGRGILVQTRECYFDSFPGERIAGYWYDRFPTHIRRAYFAPLADTDMRLYGAPFNTLASIQYIDSSGVTQTLSSSTYTVDTSREPVRLSLAYGMAWPATQAVANAVTVTYSIGWATAAAVPAALIAAMKLIIADLYDYRSAQLDARTYENQTVMRLLNPYILTHVAGEHG